MEIIIYFILVIILIVLGCNLLHKYYYIKNIESFDNVSPYLQNMSYPYVWQKHYQIGKDHLIAMMKDTITQDLYHL